MAELGGFIQDASVDGRSVRRADGSTAVVDRWANYTVRIPAARFNDFLSRTGSIGNVTSTSRSAENVTSQYTDYQARLDSLTIQEERLLDMLEQTPDDPRNASVQHILDVMSHLTPPQAERMAAIVENAYQLLDEKNE